MDPEQQFLSSLLEGLPETDRSGLMNTIRDAHRSQLDRKQNPPRRRRRNADGELVDPPPLEGDSVPDDVDELDRLEQDEHGWDEQDEHEDVQEYHGAGQ